MILQNGIAANYLHCVDLFGLAKPNIVDRLMSVLAYWMLAHQARDLDYKCVCVIFLTKGTWMCTTNPTNIFEHKK